MIFLLDFNQNLLFHFQLKSESTGSCSLSPYDELCASLFDMPVPLLHLLLWFSSTVGFCLVVLGRGWGGR